MTDIQQDYPFTPAWQRYLLRVGIVFILLLSIPLQEDFYRTLFSISWENLVVDLFNLVVFLPHFFGENTSLYDWLLLLAVAFAIAFVWLQREAYQAERERRYYYFLRVFARFRLASILFVAGFTKLFAIFAPELSLSHLNTGYGYFEDWKQLLLSLSAAPAYLVFLGIVEVASALLLLLRRTSFLAVIIIIPFYGNVFMANLAYGGDYYLASNYIILLTLPIFIYNVSRLGRLVVSFELTLPNAWYFDWKALKFGRWRWTAKLLFALIFVFAVGLRSYSVSKSGSLFYPAEKGLPGIAGKYIVESYVLNGDSIDYSSENLTRWNDVVFEEWNTLSVRVKDTIHAASSKELFSRKGSERDYEYSQVGDRLYYRYEVVANSNIIKLRNPNPAYREDQFNLSLQRPDSVHVYLRGINAQGDSLAVVLTKTDRKYLLEEIKTEGRRKLGFKL